MSRSEVDRAFSAYLAHRRPEDLARVFDEVAPRLLLLANHVVGEPGEAEDIVQATFLRAIEIADRFERGRPVVPWLTGILVLEAKKARRRAGRTPDPRRLTWPHEATPAELAELEEFREALLRALDELPSAYRDVLALRVVHGLTATEIAHALEIPPETVKTRIRRGTERLRNLVPAAFAPALAVVAFSGRSLASVREAVLAGAVERAALVAPATAIGPAASVGRWVVAGGIAAAATVGALYVLDGSDVVPLDDVQRIDVPLERDPEELPLRTAVVDPDRDASPESGPAPDRDLIAFEGRLRNERGLPLAGAFVEILRLHPDVLLTRFGPLPEVLTAPPVVAGSCVSDAEGAFVVEGIPPWGSFVLRLQPPGEPSRIELLAVRPEPAQRVDLGTRQLLPLLESHGLVVDASGRPVAGARLRRQPTPWQAPDWLGVVGELLEHACRPELDRAGAIAVRGARGLCVFRQPPWFAELLARLSAPAVFAGDDGGFVWRSTDTAPIPVAVDAPGYALRELSIAPGSRGAQRIVLESLEDVDIAVIDVRGGPVAGAEVLLGVLGADDSCALQSAGTTDADGRLRVPFRDRVPLVVAARRGEGEPWFAAELQPRLTRILQLPARFPVELRCIDGRGRPVDGVRVRLVPGEPLAGKGLGTLALHQLGGVAELELGGRESRPDRGVVAIDDVPSGAWLALVAAPGHVPRAVPFDLRGRHELGVVLAAAGTTSVRARDAQFVALGDAPLVARSLGREDAPHVLPVLCGLTSREGGIEFLRDVWGRSAVSAATSALGWMHAQAGAGTTELDLVLPARGRIEGRLVSAREDFDPAHWLVVARREPSVDVAVGEPLVLVMPRADGQFELPALEPDRWTAYAVPRSLSMTDPGRVLDVLFDDLDGASCASVEVEPGGYAMVVLDPYPPVADETPEDEVERSFRGIVRLDGQPAQGLRIEVEQGGRVVVRVVDAEGRFDIGELPAGTAEIRLGDPRGAGSPNVDGVFWHASIPVGDAPPPELAIDLQTAAWSSILTTADGRRAGAVELVLIGRVPASSDGFEGEARFTLRADAGGFAAADALPAGRYTARVMHPELGWLARDELAIGPDEVTTGMSIRLEPLLVASGRVVAAALDVELPTGSEIAVERVATDGVALSRIARLGYGGGFRVDGLLPGRYRPTVRAALRVARPDGTIVIVPPARSGVAVPLPEFDVPGRNVDGLVFDSR